MASKAFKMWAHQGSNLGPPDSPSESFLYGVGLSHHPFQN